MRFPSAFRCNFLLDNVIEKVLTLTRRKEKYLVVAAVRFVRTILSRHVSQLYGTDSPGKGYGCADGS